MPKTKTNWSQTLRAARDGLTAAQAAALIPGLSVRTWREWESGRTAPPAWAQPLILRALAEAR